MKLIKPFIFIFIASFMMTGCANGQTSQTKGTIEDVDSKRFKELSDPGNGIILDVRTAKEVADGYIPGAVHLDIYKDDFVQHINKLAKDKEIYVYCAAGGRSSDAAELLQKNGFAKVYNLEDGFTDWKKKGFPVIKD
ncbi:MAG: rhodanese-like domain-containing protein [Saprospiraceae bacterium]